MEGLPAQAGIEPGVQRAPKAVEADASFCRAEDASATSATCIKKGLATGRKVYVELDAEDFKLKGITRYPRVPAA
jgi:hypothetical protein